jgi:hypothetical protein
MGLAGRDRPQLVAGAAAALAFHFLVTQFDQAPAFAIFAFPFYLGGLGHGDVSRFRENA